MIMFFIGFVGVWLPGPDMFLIFRTSINDGFRKAIYTLFGILTGNLIYILFVILGISLYLEKFINYILLFGSLYIIYVGFFSLKLKKDNLIIKNNSIKNHSNFTKKSYYLNGLMTNLSNPKAILYFTSVLLPAFYEEILLWNFVLFFIGVIFAFLSIIFIGVFLGNKIPNEFLYYINLVFSLVFIFYGLYLGFEAIQFLFDL